MPSSVIAVALTACYFLLLAAFHAWGGTTAIPSWLLQMATRFGVDGQLVLKLMVGCELSSALAMLLMLRTMGTWRWFPRVCAITAAFVALAQCSAVFVGGAPKDAADTRWLMPLLALGTSLALLWLLGRKQVASKGAAPTAIRVIVMSLLSLIIGFGVGGRIPEAPHSDSKRTRVVELDTALWTGQTIPETGLGGLLPQLTSLTLEGRSIIVFYDPRCGQCHELFKEHFSQPRPERVIAVLVPPAADAVLVESDQPEEIECDQCQHLALPTGPTWLLTPPVIAVVENGRVVCVAERDHEACLVSTEP